MKLFNCWCLEYKQRDLTGGRNSEVECQLPKLNVVGSIPIARSIFYLKFAVLCVRSGQNLVSHV